MKPVKFKPTEFPPDQEIIIMGVPADESSRIALKIVFFQPKQGWSKVPCSKCGKDTWVGPRQLQFAQENPTSRIICMACSPPKISAIRHLGGNDGGTILTSGNGQN